MKAEFKGWSPITTCPSESLQWLGVLQPKVLPAVHQPHQRAQRLPQSTTEDISLRCLTFFNKCIKHP